MTPTRSKTTRLPKPWENAASGGDDDEEESIHGSPDAYYAPLGPTRA